MDRARVAEPYANAATFAKEKTRHLMGHYTRVSKARACIDNATPTQRTRSKVSKATQQREERLEEIEAENQRLLVKLSTIASGKAEKPDGEWKKVRSVKRRLNDGVRRREQERIWVENQVG